MSENHFQTNDSGKCYTLHNGRLKKFYRNWSFAYINFYTLQKEAIVAEGNENATELTGEHATLTQTLSLKSVVGKYIQRHLYILVLISILRIKCTV